MTAKRTRQQNMDKASNGIVELLFLLIDETCTVMNSLNCESTKLSDRIAKSVIGAFKVTTNT